MDLSGLNENQHQAVLHREGPCCVIAGAGSGKTRVLTYRIAHLVNTGVRARDILACTFTRKAAGEMGERLQALIGAAVEDLNLGTIHSICLRILREEWRDQGIHYDVLSEWEQKKIVKDILAPRSSKNPDGMNWDLDVAAALRRIGSFKNELLTVNEVWRRAEADLNLHRYAQLYELYERKKAEIGRIDFDDMLLLCHTLIADNPAILGKWQQRFKWVLVDEVQDTNRAQWEILRMLARPEDNIFVVGDDYQSIYGFRGAHPEYIVRFKDWYQEARVIVLDTNYRSTENIITASNAVIANNRNQVKKTLKAFNGRGDDPTILQADDEDHEAEIIADEIEALAARGVGYGDVAVLYRTNAQSRPFEDAFIARAIPHYVVGACGFYGRKEVKDIIAYLEAVVDPSADDAVTRVINVPSRYLGKAFVTQVQRWASMKGVSLLEALVSCPGLKPYQQRGVLDFLDIIETIRHRGPSPAEAVMLARRLARYDEHLRRDEGADDDADNSRIDNLNELVSAATRFGTLPEFVRFAKSAAQDKADDDQAPDKVQLMTLHKAKGLEFDHVVVAGACQGLLPHRNSVEYIDGEIVPESVEEERRLCYVGMTRARKTLYLSHFQSYRGKPMEASMFLAEFSPGLREVVA